MYLRGCWNLIKIYIKCSGSNDINICQIAKQYDNVVDFVECADGFYNKNCSGICGVCVNDEVCEKTNGICENGCKTNFQGPLCQGILPTTY